MAAFDAALRARNGTGAAPGAGSDELDRLAHDLSSSQDVLQLPADTGLLRRLIARKVAARRQNCGRSHGAPGLPKDLLDVLDLPDDVTVLKGVLADEVAAARFAASPAAGSRPARIQSWSPQTAARLGPGRHHCRDGSGMWADVSPNLRVCFSGAWRVRDRRQRVERSLGSYPAVQFDRAQCLALEYRALCRRGEVPPLRRVPGLTIAAAIDRFFEDRRDVWSPQTYRNYRQAVDRYLMPTVGSLLAVNVTTGKLATAVRPAWMQYRRVGRDLLTVLNGAFRLVKANGVRPDLVTEGITDLLPKIERSERHHKAIPLSQVPELLARARDFRSHVPEVQPSDAAAALAVEFAVLSVLRRGAACWLRKEALQAHEGIPILTIPAEFMKIKDHDHDVVVSSAIKDVLARAEGLGIPDAENPEGRFFVYRDPRSGAVAPVSLNVVSNFPRRLGFDCTLHGFRSCFEDWATEQGVDPRWSDRIMAHAIVGVKKHYRRTRLLKQIRRVLEMWGQYATGSDTGTS